MTTPQQPAPFRAIRPRPLAAATAATAAVLFATLLTVVAIRHGAAFGWDESLHHWALTHRTPAMTSALRALTSTGTGAPPYLVAAVAGGLAVGRKSSQWWWAGLGAMAALGLAELLRTGLATALARPRPPLADWAVTAGGYAMPSGHTTASALAAIGLAAALLSRTTGRPARTACRLVPALWAVAVGLSRVYLGVHWPSDVLAGWLLATALCCALLPALGRLLRRLAGTTDDGPADRGRTTDSPDGS